MAAVALSPQLDLEPDAADMLALEREVHGRSRCASRAAEAWAGVALSLRTVQLRGASVPTGTAGADAVIARVGERAVAQGLVCTVTTASVDAVAQAVLGGARRVLAVGTPVGVQGLRVAAQALRVEQLYVLGRVEASAAAAGRDPLNALADVSMGVLPGGTTPWAVVRNARGRALLDALEADVWLDAIAPEAWRETAAYAAAQWHGQRPRVVT